MQGLRADTIFICESWETKEQIPSLDHYRWFGNPRVYVNKKAPRVSGGMGFFIHEQMLSLYKVQQVAMDTDSMLILHLIHKQSDYSILLIGCYLAPENSVYGRNADSSFDNIMNVMYEYPDVNLTLLMGDLNCRLGKLQDYIVEVDDIPERVPIDETDNAYGQAFQDFLIEGKLAVLNGRVCPLNDSYTCISHKGRSVVDYIATAHENLKNIISFNVLPITELVDEFDCRTFVREESLITQY